MTGKLSADLSGRTALVTGASGGLGRHFSILLAASGARVVAAARNMDKLAQTVDIITSSGDEALAVSLDVKDEASIAAATQASGAIDILVNNAGIASSKRVLDWQGADWDDVMETNLRGAWMVAAAVASQMRERDASGSIINIASILGERVGSGVMPYAVSKAGLVQMTKAMALELAGKGIRVNALAPGYIKTDINRDFLQSEGGLRLLKRIPQGRFGEPDDLDGALLLLASDGSKFINGAVIAVDGGHLVSSL
ncbi:MAG: SDR family oxidoreductase [Rhodospirillaceae bacterium]|jgi:NAD(P)-dependent dehydrogenase (short-subunit alcohol dehydrogenase family)|nr:SDR family oxidoreductase [Rhodospirillaceae bacterium]MBT5244727.1 SDR family oxidoreductase [Rhodospirillaceae bacterium]MBT5562468.1 SDR family oxidoreductase [Rhodospirillaceae bacterium]MBT6242106.1 SDR family oxidoreductase [Rhodospirillaceae bacterium]MBT7136503.1 SDR family oxidoreductase [Rhodospirillaceae bacterium]